MRHAALRKEVEDIKYHINAKLNPGEPHITIYDDYRILFHKSPINDGKPYIYVPSPTGYEFHKNRDAYVKTMLGPFGSGKTVACCMDIIIDACAIKPCSDGIRRSRWYVVRDTYPNIKRAVYSTWRNWFTYLGDAPVFKRSFPLEFKSRFNDGHGIVDLEIEFFGLDDVQGPSKLLSTEITGAYINECRTYASNSVFETLQGRIGRYPPAIFFDDGEQVDGKIIMDTNPPDTDSWFYDLFEVRKPKSYFLYRQPGGLILTKDGEYQKNPEAENLSNLSKNYYLNQAQGKDQDYIKVELMGEYGVFNQGDPVFNDYVDTMHTTTGIEIIRDIDVVVGMDFGLTPAVVFTQMHPNGRLCIFKEIVTFNTPLTQFLENHMVPYCQSYLKDMNLIVCPDPSGVAQEQVDGSSCIGTLKTYGFDVMIPRTNDIDPRLSAVKMFLNKLIDKKPSYQLDKEGAPTLRKGFSGGYVLSNRGGEWKPDKNDYSHVHDANQYACMYHANMIRGSDEKHFPSYSKPYRI